MSGVLWFNKPLIVALATLRWVGEPKDFASISLTPATSSTCLAAPPAITPVPGAAGFRSTLEDPCFPIMEWTIVEPAIGISWIFFLAFSIAFWIASGTSEPFPYPIPAFPFPSPTATRAVNAKFLPPFTTLATLLMWITLSWSSSSAIKIQFLFL